MAVGTAAILGTTALAAGGFSAFSQIKAGKQQSSNLLYQGNFNSQVYDQQAQMILEKKKLQEYQFGRARGQAQGAVISHTAGAGFEFGGSPMAIAVDNETQMLLDQAVGNYNLDIERNYALSAATASTYEAGQQAKLARTTGYTNAFSTILNTGTNIFLAGKL